MSFRENDEESLAHTVFTQYINEQENQMEAELAFDASFFKANRKVNCFVTVLYFAFRSENNNNRKHLQTSELLLQMIKTLSRYLVPKFRPRYSWSGRRRE